MRATVSLFIGRQHVRGAGVNSGDEPSLEILIARPFTGAIDQAPESTINLKADYYHTDLRHYEVRH